MESPFSALKKFLIGAFLGLLSFVPGVSGVVFAVVFGVYERLVADIADIYHKIRSDFWFLLTLGVGLVFGVVVASFALKGIIDTVPAMLLFLGMILGQMPHLWKYTVPEKKPSSVDVVALIVGILIMCIFLFFAAAPAEYPTHNASSIILMILIGIVYAIAHIAPGISGSTLLLAMGLLVLPMDVISSFDFVLLLPFVLGAVVGIIGFAKIVHYAIANYRKPTYMMIFGLTVGSFLVVAKNVYNLNPGTGDIVIGAIALVVGIVISLLISRIGKRTSAEFVEIIE